MAWPKWLLQKIAQVACIVSAQLLADDCRSFYVNPCFYLAPLSPNLYGSTFALCMLNIITCSLLISFLCSRSGQSHTMIPGATWLLQTNIHSFPRIEPIKLRLSFSCECSHQKCPPISFLFDQMAVSLADFYSFSMEIWYTGF